MKSVYKTSDLHQPAPSCALLETMPTTREHTPQEPAAAPAPPPNAYRAKLRAALRQACGPQAVDAWALAATAAQGQGHRLREAAQLFVDGSQPTRSLWLLVDGRLSLGHLDASARWRQSRELKAGDWIDAGSAWINCKPAETALALEPCLVHEFQVEALMPLCQIHSDLMRALLACVATRGREAVLDRQALLTQGSMARLANWLLHHCEPKADGSATLQLRLQKRDLASQLGITPETLSRSLRQLRDRSLLIMNGYRLNLPDLSALRELSYQDAGWSAN